MDRDWLIPGSRRTANAWKALFCPSGFPSSPFHPSRSQITGWAVIAHRRVLGEIISAERPGVDRQRSASRSRRRFAEFHTERRSFPGEKSASISMEDLYFFIHRSAPQFRVQF